MLFGGQAADADSVRRLLKTGKPQRLLHMYGPTETTAWCSYEQVEQVAEDAPTVSVGRATGNQRVYLLDAALEPVPVGVPGEAYVGGAGVVRGYLERPGLTAERFVPDPFSAEPGARMYRTGDRLRWRGEGKLEFMGRVDEQVKIRGFRIEPGEVESAVSAHAAVREARVVVREDVPGELRLVAYVVGEVGVEEVRAHLKRCLPEYMMPAAIVSLEALPLTPNGKLDREALPAPEWSGGATYAAPRTPVEEVLAGIVADVLRVERVGTEDDFFELGGHSLLATRVVSRVRQAFGVELPLRALFEAPVVARLARRIEALLAGGEGTQAPPLVPLPRDGSPLPLSFAQQRLWFIDRLEPGSAAYNMPYALRLRGRFDPAVLERAVTEIVRRHETLRTVFREVDGEPAQVIRDAAPVALPVTDLRGLPAQSREAEALRLASEEGARPFDLAAGPLLRSTLLRIADDDHVLCFTMHHVVSDGWSMEVLVREVSALYGAFGQGEPSPLAELPVQYADYAAWQRSWLGGGVLEEQVGYWKEKLAGAPPLLEVPVDRPRAAGRSPRAASHGFRLSPGLSDGLREISAREGTTLFMTLLAAWQALLGRWSGEEDVVVGTPVAGRTRRETEGLIGFFVNMLPLRADLAGDPTWSELLGRTRETALGAYAHQELPFERLVEELSTERSLAHSALFQTTFALVVSRGDDDRLVLGDLGLEPFGGGGSVARFDLDLVLADAGEALSGAIVYSEALFEDATAARMAEHLEVLLEAMAGDPGQGVRERPLLRGAERARVLEAWNATAVPVPPGCVHERFAEQAARTPGAVALVHGAERLTYAELAALVSRLALRLGGLGVGPEVRVGICLERSPAMIAAVLATLAAGGAYVPIDPVHPAERVAYLLEDSGVQVVVTQSSLAGRFAAFGGRLALVDGEEAHSGLSARVQAASARNLAYVIYTSGSTGMPKGVGVEHASLASYAHVVRGFYGITPADRVLQFNSLSFDVSADEIYPTLLAGATLVLRSEEMLGSAARFLDRCAEWGVTVLDLPTSYWHELAAALDAGEARLPACVRLVVVGSERMLAERVAQWRRSVGNAAALVNGYGPTEATVAATLGRVDGGKLTIGAPVGNVKAYVLEPSGVPAPVGVPGELWIGGAGVARGYLGRPELTAERFWPDPFSGEAGGRMYRSGDRVRWLATGELEYLGRTDAQVKVRGFRIEPGEVEAALSGMPGVREATVVAREHGDERRLVAYVVAEPGRTVSPADVRTWLRDRLPEYMVPAAVVALESIPLTANLKVDHRALPAPGWRAGGEDARVDPRTGTEEVLAGIWGEVLRLDRVGVEDSFFDVGGHSLLATRVVSRVRQAFGVELPLRTLFEAPTVARLAEWVEANRPEDRLDAWEVREEEERLAGLSDEEVRRMLEEP